LIFSTLNISNILLFS